MALYRIIEAHRPDNTYSASLMLYVPVTPATSSFLHHSLTAGLQEKVAAEGFTRKSDKVGRPRREVNRKKIGDVTNAMNQYKSLANAMLYYNIICEYPLSVR